MLSKPRTYSRYSAEAAILLGAQIRLGRKKRKWTESELASRAGISRATLQKIEKGNMTCALGLFFEAAVLVRVELFDSAPTSLGVHIERVNDKLSLLPKAIHKSRGPVDDDF